MTAGMNPKSDIMKTHLSFQNKPLVGILFFGLLITAPIFVWGQADTSQRHVQTVNAKDEYFRNSLVMVDPCLSAPYKALLKLSPNVLDYEKKKIEYLLDRVSRTPYNFVRNGQEYGGQMAVAHLRLKWFRAIKEVKTAAVFVDKIGSRSSLSGQPYYVKVNGDYYPLHDFLLNELKKLEQALVQGQAKCSG